MKMANKSLIIVVVLFLGIFGGVIGRNLNQQRVRETEDIEEVEVAGQGQEQGQGQGQVKIDKTQMQVCRLNNCTLFEYNVEDLGTERKKATYYYPPTYQRSNSRWSFGWRKLLDVAGVEGVGCAIGDFGLLRVPPCCDEYVVLEDFVSVCRISEQLGIDCDLFMMFNDLDEEYVNSGTVIQICASIKAGDLIQKMDFYP